jgi:hypothetical protein
VRAAIELLRPLPGIGGVEKNATSIFAKLRLEDSAPIRRVLAVLDFFQR